MDTCEHGILHYTTNSNEHGYFGEERFIKWYVNRYVILLNATTPDTVFSLNMAPGAKTNFSEDALFRSIKIDNSIPNLLVTSLKEVI